MQDDVLQRFRQFRVMLVSSNVPNNILLDMLESYITSDVEVLAAEDEPVLDGQLSLFDVA